MCFPKCLDSVCGHSLKNAMLFMTIVGIVIQLLLLRGVGLGVVIIDVAILLLVYFEDRIPPWSVYVHLFFNILVMIEAASFILFSLAILIQLITGGAHRDSEPTRAALYIPVGVFNVVYAFVYWSYYHEIRDKLDSRRSVNQV